ncbi:hypothetical protein PR048_030269 [Dryococelus australis]|uniref:Uncharacterized protein n=1 Tax=Dryococelus australis TaxID=614101 RepID=A0ABQ9G8I4_9NEOP|nr:hypothetical protein PR048_030269 [Dryococelus australis]
MTYRCHPKIILFRVGTPNYRIRANSRARIGPRGLFFPPKVDFKNVRLTAGPSTSDCATRKRLLRRRAPEMNFAQLRVNGKVHGRPRTRVPRCVFLLGPSGLLASPARLENWFLVTGSHRIDRVHYKLESVISISEISFTGRRLTSYCRLSGAVLHRQLLYFSLEAVNLALACSNRRRARPFGARRHTKWVSRVCVATTPALRPLGRRVLVARYRVPLVRFTRHFDHAEYGSAVVTRCRPLMAQSVGAPPIWGAGGSRFESRHADLQPRRFKFSPWRIQVRIYVHGKWQKLSKGNGFSRGIPAFITSAFHNASAPPFPRPSHARPGSPNFCKWKSCWTVPLVGGFSRGSPVSPTPSFRRRSIFISITLIGSQDIACLNVNGVEKKRAGGGGNVELGAILGEPPRFSHVGNVADITAGQRGFFEAFHRCCIFNSFHFTLAPNNSLLSVDQIFCLVPKYGVPSQFSPDPTSSQCSRVLRVPSCTVSSRHSSDILSIHTTNTSTAVAS